MMASNPLTCSSCGNIYDTYLTDRCDMCDSIINKKEHTMPAGDASYKEAVEQLHQMVKFQEMKEKKRKLAEEYVSEHKSTQEMAKNALYSGAVSTWKGVRMQNSIKRKKRSPVKTRSKKLDFWNMTKSQFADLRAKGVNIADLAKRTEHNSHELDASEYFTYDPAKNIAYTGSNPSYTITTGSSSTPMVTMSIDAANEVESF